ncbi:MAG: PTS sugar transporter subunit IIC [Gemmatimonadetes bacterium]|nr:PTS sugar transporter subunit IIC [Gemmatimonadota bacterium]
MSLLPLSFVGGLLALDETSVGQFMVSRPLVVGLLAGWVVGDPMTGALVGAILEIYLLVSLPVGGARFPEGATATVVAVGSAAAGDLPGALALGVAVGLVWGHIGGLTISGLRTFSVRLAPDPGRTSVTPGRVVAGHLGAIVLDFLRGMLVTASGVLVGRLVVAALASSWPLAAGNTLGLLLVGGAVSVGALLRGFGGFRRRRDLFAAGLAAGALGAWLL